MPVLAPLVVGARVAFVSFEDDRDFAAAEGLEFTSPRAVGAVQQYFDLLWRDSRAIRLRTSAAGTLESGVTRAEAELRAFAKYQRHRHESGLSSGDSEIIEAYLAAERRFEAEMELRKAIRSVRGNVLWYEAHHSVNSLDALYEAVDRHAVRTIRLLSGDSNLRGNPKKTVASFEKFADEMAGAGDITCEWRILRGEQTRTLHGRVLLDDEMAITLPPLNAVLKGTVDAIRHAGLGFDRDPYLTAWESAKPLNAWQRELQG